MARLAHGLLNDSIKPTAGKVNAASQHFTRRRRLEKKIGLAG